MADTTTMAQLVGKEGVSVMKPMVARFVPARAVRLGVTGHQEAVIRARKPG